MAAVAAATRRVRQRTGRRRSRRACRASSSPRARSRTACMHGVHGRRQAGPGETFWQFRPFVSGEPAARVDWRRSARENRAFVREREWEASHIALDLVRPLALDGFRLGTRVLLQGRPRGGAGAGARRSCGARRRARRPDRPDARRSPAATSSNASPKRSPPTNACTMSPSPCRPRRRSRRARSAVLIGDFLADAAKVARDDRDHRARAAPRVKS